MPTTDTVVNGTYVSDVQSGGEALWASVQAFVASVLQLLPEIIAALLVLIVGWIIASALGRLARKLVVWSRVDRLLRSADTEEGALQEVVMKYRIADFARIFVKWLLIILVLAIVADILNWTQFTELLNTFIAYLPNVAAAILLLLGGYLLGNLVQTFIAEMDLSFGQRAVRAMADVARWVVIVFAAMAALIQLGIAESLIQIAFVGLVAMLSLAGGLAFGLGGRDKARELLSDVKPPRTMTA